MPVEASEYLRAMSRVPGPVTVVTTADGQAHRWGFTGTSFSALSLDPPLVLVCLNRTASTHEVFTAATSFMVNVLTADQHQVAVRFAASGVDRFQAGDMQPCELGLPGLPSCAARVACSTYAVLDGGDHSIIVGRVEALHVGDAPPLVYWDRTFAGPVPVEQAAGVH